MYTEACTPQDAQKDAQWTRRGARCIMCKHPAITGRNEALGKPTANVCAHSVSHTHSKTVCISELKRVQQAVCCTHQTQTSDPQNSAATMAVDLGSKNAVNFSSSTPTTAQLAPWQWLPVQICFVHGAAARTAAVCDLGQTARQRSSSMQADVSVWTTLSVPAWQHAGFILATKQHTQPRPRRIKSCAQLCGACSSTHGLQKHSHRSKKGCSNP